MLSKQGRDSLGVFFGCLLLGVSLSAPIGPINAAQLHTGMRYGFLRAWFVGIGAMCADAVYMTLIYFGLASFLNTPVIQIGLWLFGALVLVYLGMDTLRSLDDFNRVAEKIRPTPVKALSAGFLMAISNPLNVLFWFGIYGSILAESTKHRAAIEYFPSIGIFAGIFVWDFVMALIASTFQRLVSPRWLRIISALAGFMLIGFGLYFGVKAHQAIF